MQKLFVMGLLIVLVVLLVVGYQTNYRKNIEKIDSQSGKIVALSTFTIIADMVSVVGGDRVESVSLTKPGVEIHGYEPTPGDLIRASKASVLFENGMNLELWTAKLRTSLPDVPVVTVSDGIEVVYIADGSYQGKPNPHAWMSPKQGLVYIENIRRSV
jgi:ABC-type Zn uptake system ZnuABC Zn-binding protein ZnuA